MKRRLTDEEKKDLFEEVRQFLADEFEMDVSEITEETNIIDDLGGDSILFLEMIEEFKGKYEIDLEVRIIGQYMLKHPVYTVGETLNAVFDIIEKGEDLIEEIGEGESIIE
ncbi:MAG: acyl carrier protein [Thermodesulfobacteriota bacterium]|nr:acyl carrier protein [Thermodesulfobacteriota bacterium]